MNPDNGAARTKRELLVATARLAYAGRLVEGVDRVPYELTSRPGYAPATCCVEHDRHLLRARLVACLGFAQEGRVDDGSALSLLAEAALQREPGTDVPGQAVMTVIAEACNGCVASRTFVTDACQACLARPCETGCPKGAIRVSGGRARIDASSCVDCGICVKACPYKSIVRLPVPCEEACPVGAIREGPGGKEELDRAACVTCGACAKACPFGAITDVSRLVDVIRAIRSGRRVAAILAPAIAAQFRAPIAKLASAVRLAGFASVHEAALGADEAAAMEAEEYLERIGSGEPFMTTSCCPAYVQAVRRHVPALAGRISRTPSPMSLAAESAARAEPDALVVFVGPCLAKRREALSDPRVDFVLSAEELGAMFVASGIEVADATEDGVHTPASREGRGFAAAGGVTAAVRALLPPGADIRAVTLDGLSKEGISILRAWAEGNGQGDFLEVMACKGGCVGGPCSLINPRVAALQLKRIAETSEPILSRNAAPLPAGGVHAYG